MKITNISSNKDCIIKQEIYSTMTVYNLLSSIVNDLEEEIDQSKYKHKQKINFNMAVGFVKRFLLIILLEKDIEKKRNCQMNCFKIYYPILFQYDLVGNVHS